MSRLALVATFAALLVSGCADTELADNEDNGELSLLNAASAGSPVKVAGGAIDVGTSTSGSVMVIGTNNVTYQWLGGDQWNGAYGGWNTRVALDKWGNTYVISGDNTIWRWTAATGWQKLPGWGIDIGVGGPNDDVWLVGTDSQLWHLESSNWVPYGGNVRRVTVDHQGQPWVVNVDYAILQYVNGFHFRAGFGYDIGAGISGAIYIAGTDRNLYQWNGGGWNQRSDLGGNAANVAVDNSGQLWWTTTDNSIWHTVPAKDLQAPFLTTQQQAALDCQWSAGPNSTYNITCTSSQGGPGVTLSGATGTITSASNYQLTVTADNLAALVPGVSGLLEFLSGGVVSGLSGATLTLYGPDNGNKAVVNATVGFGSYFQPLDDAIAGLTGGAVSFMADKFPITATLQNGVVTAQVQLLPTTAHPSVGYTEAVTGMAVVVNAVTIHYVSNPKAVTVSVGGTFKLAANDPAAALTIAYTRKGDGGVEVSGTLKDLAKPFGGLVPLSLQSGSFTAVQAQGPKGKPIIKKIAISVEKGTLFDNVELGGSFVFDKTVSPALLQFSLAYKICGNWNWLVFNSADLNAIPNQMIKIVGDFGSSIGGCVQNAKCPAGYTKTGLQCDKTCPAFFANSPGLCTHTTQTCPNPTIGYIWPNCKSYPGPWCGEGATLTAGILGPQDICAYTCPNVGLTGSLPSCINPDQAKPLIW